MRRFDFSASPYPIRPDLVDGFEREWDRLHRPGTWWSGPERVAMVAEMRRAQAGAAPRGDVLPAAAVDAVRTVAVAPRDVDASWVDDLADRGVDAAPYVEIVGVVSRGSAVDGFHRALDFALPPLPEPAGGEPPRSESAAAGRGRAFVPMVGAASIVGALSLVPAEMEAQRDLHGPLYMDYDEMPDMEFTRGLTRPQMELVAGRTSAVNDCFY